MADNRQNKPTEKDCAPKDEYYGRYKDGGSGKSTEERFGTGQNPVRETKTPFKNMKNAGG